MDKNVCLVGLHIPKCAGTSILRGFTSILEPNSVYQCTSLLDNYIQQRPEFVEIVDYSQLKLVFGHHLYDEMLKCLERVYLFTILRDPVERGVSNFYYANWIREELKQPPMTLNQYLAAGESILEFLLPRFQQFIFDQKGTSVDKAVQIFSHFDFVGSTKSIEKLQGEIEKLFGIKFEKRRSNVSKIDYESDQNYEEIKAAVQKRYKEDVELYELFVKKNEEHNFPDNPFLNPERIHWRNNEFLKKKCDYGYVMQRLVPLFIGEFRNFGILDDVLALNKRKKDFYWRMKRRLLKVKIKHIYLFLKSKLFASK